MCDYDCKCVIMYVTIMACKFLLYPGVDQSLCSEIMAFSEEFLIVAVAEGYVGHVEKSKVIRGMERKKSIKHSLVR
jgi:hypothetical protein